MHNSYKSLKYFIKSKKQSNRPLKVSSVIHNLIANIIINNQVYLPNINVNRITIYEVLMSSDLRYANIYLVILGDDVDYEEQLKIINNHASEFRYIIGKKMRQMRYIPELRFYNKRKINSSYISL
ncbi:ribosome-binding factor A [Lyticum sinuosum]|uniref:Ribosome-binding factor A n=1 Tax=Lyticum sinuosum TaxID=1332059 RepID=A0AAE5AHJ8_9RICK|nr:ribosome-binding factor A [Lyticum sinuosum]MDZ5761208.1 Ribosome-binding factor A [Lyticum sinuosum]